MLPRLAPAFLAMLLLGSASCGIVSPYAEAAQREKEQRGLHVLKLRGAVWETIDIEKNELGAPANQRTVIKSEEENFQNWGIEVERLIADLTSVTVSFDAREHEPENEDIGRIKDNRLHVGARRYFGTKALTAFLAAQAVFGFELDFEGGDGRHSDSYLGWAAGGGLNLAVTENLSIESYVMYEGMPEAETRPDSPGAVDDFSYTLSGVVAYVGIGFHF